MVVCLRLTAITRAVNRQKTKEMITQISGELLGTKFNLTAKKVRLQKNYFLTLIVYAILDTLMNGEVSTSTKKRDDLPASPCKKRRRSCKGTDEVPLTKRGRKPINRSRHNSDSDDTSEHSIPGTTSIVTTTNIDTRFARSPRPSKYNFYVEFGNLDDFLNQSK